MTLRPPPTTAQWQRDSELHGGHTVEQVTSYLSTVADWEDWLAERRRPEYLGIIPTGGGLQLPRWLRRRARRSCRC